MKWPLRKLDKLGLVARGRSRHRPRDAAHLYGGPYPFIQTADVKHSQLYLNVYSQTYSAAGLAQSRLWSPGTLCITIAANIADTAILGIEACFPDSIIGFVADESKADVRFIKYLFDAMLQKRFKQFTQGSAQDNLSQEKLLSLDFPVPKDVHEQRRIADILSAYDDLIENNRRRIQLLEQAARLLYKEWFVHLRFPGHEHVKITETAVGRIPADWSTSTLENACELIVDSEHKTAPVEDSGFPMIRTPDISKGYLLLNEARQVSQQTFEAWTRRAVPRHGDLILAREAPVGNVGIVPAGEKVCLGQRTVLLRPNCEFIQPNVLLRILLSDYCQNAFTGASSGVTVAHLNLRDLRRMIIPIPTHSLQEIAAAYLAPIDAQIALLFRKIRSLTKARDLLLPRLMNGEIPV